MGCLFSCFQDKQIYENVELRRSLINNNTQIDDYYSDDNNEFDYDPYFFERVYRRRFVSYD